ncbi:hypothetical protein ACHAWF_001518, partial [Thalassiosira exigua]
MSRRPSWPRSSPLLPITTGWDTPTSNVARRNGPCNATLLWTIAPRPTTGWTCSFRTISMIASARGASSPPRRKTWSKISPEDLVYSSASITADGIHDAVYSARPDIKAAIHLHIPTDTAVSCLEEEFVPFTQDAVY